MKMCIKSAPTGNAFKPAKKSRKCPSPMKNTGFSYIFGCFNGFPVGALLNT